MVYCSCYQSLEHLLGQSKHTVISVSCYATINPSSDANVKYCGSFPTTQNNVALVWVLYSVFSLDTNVVSHILAI